MKIASFFGHRDFRATNELESRIKNEIISCIEEKNITNFYLGRNGYFDLACARYLKEFKQYYPEIKVFLILAYLRNNIDELEKENIEELFDEVIYPPIEEHPYKWSIYYRNKWMIENSDFVIFYVDKTWGGAYKMLNYAIKNKYEYCNIAQKV